MFKQPSVRNSLYNKIIRIAILTVKPDNIAAFPGQRILGTRIKHHMGDVSIKMYDKLGRVLRIDSISNNIDTYRIKQQVEHRDGNLSEQKAPLKKYL